MSIHTITPQELHERCQGNTPVELIDVRTPAEYREVHAEQARNVPLDTLDPAAVMSARNGTSGSPVYVMCRTGNRSRKACEKFIASGYEQVVNVSGGVQAWDEAGLPVQRGKKAISLERQVPIAAGFLVLLGVGLGFWHPAFLALSAIVGAGLMFAGITDTCGMAMLLARMPWNRARCETMSNEAECRLNDA